MIRQALIGIILLCLTLSGASCSLSRSEINDIQIDLNQMKLEFGRLRSSQADGFRKIEYSLEQIEKSIESQRQLEKTFTSDVSAELSRIRKTLIALSASPGAAPGPKPGNDAEEKSLTNEDETVVVDNAALASTPEQTRLLEKAAEAFSLGQFDEAIEIYSDFLIDNRDSPVAPDAAYYLARSYYSQEKFDRALRAFDHVLDAYPASAIIPHALISKALTLNQLKRKDQALATVQKLKNTYPEYEPDFVDQIEKEISQNQ